MGVACGAPGADHGRLGLQQVLAGFDLDRVHTAVDHGRDLGVVGVTQGDEVDVAQGRQLGARPDGTEHPVAGAGLVGGLTGKACAGTGQLGQAIGDSVFPQGGGIRPEGIGFDDV